jgi:hypothetical protein
MRLPQPGGAARPGAWGPCRRHCKKVPLGGKLKIIAYFGDETYVLGKAALIPSFAPAVP